ncbi:hypothetical protein BDZ45DRAFT_741283 [Acephala macrosclerotiorum]|nr:hypothetical protein BDZ45DRAFT_741283 [Acephala macrosclerotiorum]
MDLQVAHSGYPKAKELNGNGGPRGKEALLVSVFQFNLSLAALTPWYAVVF